MKKHLILLLFVLFSNLAVAQDFSNLANASFKSREDYKNAESTVLKCADYLLANPIDRDPNNRINSFQYLFKWMEGTPDHTFSVDVDVMKLTDDNQDLLTMYFVSMAKAVLSESGNELTGSDINDQAILYMIEYCSNEQNNLKPSKKMKKIAKKKTV